MAFGDIGFAGGDALDVHFGQGQFEGLLAAHALFEGAGIEFDAATDLGDGEGDGGQTEVEGFVLEAVGVAGALIGTLVRLSFENLGAFLEHRLVDEQADAFSQAVGAFFGNELQDGVQEFRLVLVGHVVLMLDVFGDTPTGNQYGPPSTSFSRAPLHPCGVRLRCGSLRSPPLRLTPQGWRQREERQFTERFLHPLLNTGIR